MVPRWRFFGEFLRPAFPASRVQHLSDLHSKFALWPHRVEVWQTSDLRRLRLSEEKKKKKEETTEQKYNGLPYSIKRPERKIERRNYRAKYNGIPYSIERP